MTPDRTVTLPTKPGASWDNFGWTAKAPEDDLDYALDATDWMEGNGLSLASATISASAGLNVTDISYVVTDGAYSGILLRISGGISGGVPPMLGLVSFRLLFTSGRQLNLLVALPIKPSAPALIPAAIQPGGIVDGAASVVIDDAGDVLLPS